MPDAALYARVSTKKQVADLQLDELRAYCQRRGWQATEYLDQGVSGAKDHRPALDRLMADARRRRFSAVVVWKFDRFGRSLRHLVNALDEFRSLGIDFVSLTESVDTSTPAGKLAFSIFSAVAEFERDLTRERIRAGMEAAKEKLKRGPYRRMRDGKEHVVRRIGRPPADVSPEQIRVALARASGNKAQAARALGISVWTLRDKMRTTCPTCGKTKRITEKTCAYCAA